MGKSTSPTKSDSISNAKAKTNPRPDSVQQAHVDVSVAHVFFDGTDNNYFNTTDRKTKGIVKDDSYKNDLSNVARMWDYLRKHPILGVSMTYIDGIGTTSYDTDSFWGYSTGQGATGVSARAHGAFKAVEAKVIQGNGGAVPLYVDINVYGFSRGAAAARYFVHLVNTQKRQLFSPQGLARAHVRINFVGLFDTVSSIGALNYHGNVEAFHLNFSPGYANKVYHLVAGDEYRENFALTNIASAMRIEGGTKGERMGAELCIPGAHSEIGGGYNEVVYDSQNIDESYVKFILEQGWYTEKQIHRGDRLTAQGDYITYVTVARTVRSDTYKIGLTIMADKAKKYAHADFGGLDTKSRFPEIEDLRQKVRVFAADEHNRKYDLNVNMGKDKARIFRGKYAFMGFHKDTGMQPSSDFVRKIVQG